MDLNVGKDVIGEIIFVLRAPLGASHVKENPL